jgi:hypothetical protein
MMNMRSTTGRPHAAGIFRRNFHSFFLLLPLLIILFSLCPQGRIEALEVTTLYHMSNHGFDKDAEESSSDFNGTAYRYGVSAFGTYQIDDALSLEAGLYYDPILRKTVYTRFEYRHDYFKVGVGPFLGVFNSPGSILKSGISSSFHIEYPGKAFASVRSDSTIAARFANKGDYLQELNRLSVGYYIPFAICSLNLTTKRFITQKTDTLEVEDALTRYSFDVDIYQKNVPVKVLLSFAYQHIDRIYTSTASKSENTLNSLILGTRLEFEVSPKLSLLADLDHNIYSFGNEKDAVGSTNPLTLPDSGLGVYLFTASLGGTWRLY